MIIIDSVSPVEHGRGSVRSIYTLYADTMDEVPLTGAETKPLISGLEDDLPPTTLLYTGDYQIAVLDTYDHWRWKSESEDDTNVFYVYHSGKPAASAIETVHITSYIEEHGYDLTQNRTKGTYYGGYALAAGVTPSDDAYDGTNWTWTTMETEVPGTSITPVANETYYVKEVPYGYMAMGFIMTWSGGYLASLIPVTPVDDLHPNYVYIWYDGNRYQDSVYYTSLKVNTGSATVTYTPSMLFGDYGVSSGYIVYVRTHSTVIKPLLEPNAEIRFRAGWLTEDNVEVKSRSEFILCVNDKKTENIVVKHTIDPEVG